MHRIGKHEREIEMSGGQPRPVQDALVDVGITALRL